jgi:hypothetical protein
LFCGRFLTEAGDGDLDRRSAASLLEEEDDDEEEDDRDDEDDDEELRDPPPAALESESELLDRDRRREGRFGAAFFLAGLPEVTRAAGAPRPPTAEVVPLRRLLPDALLLPVDMGLLLPLSFRYCEQFNCPRSAVVMPPPLTTLQTSKLSTSGSGVTVMDHYCGATF